MTATVNGQATVKAPATASRHRMTRMPPEPPAGVSAETLCAPFHKTLPRKRPHMPRLRPGALCYIPAPPRGTRREAFGSDGWPGAGRFSLDVRSARLV